ncbi:hypothetical protein AB1I55_10525 [Enterococcus entomosocium]|uniref:Phage protein n=1 Tax=Enterococcus entomosocium TaxID=3034352 RepID=A0ABV3MEZ3_9ENTE|nr:hypothetical protein [Enterococcus casseliflavus]MDB1709505.1 hypothetical protein [Enterococcus casseliflavus]MDB1717500.1 hypothetical protein [Enterococcus casseliflavus]
MIEIVIKNFLDSHLSVTSFLEKKGEMPKNYVLFEKTGSGENNHISSSTYAFQSYAPTLYEAALLNTELKEVLKDLIKLDEISRIKLNSDYNYTDTSTKEYRYQAVFDITHY